jgi:hypothetical protein
MTQAFNLALLANNVNSSGQLNAAEGLYNLPIPVGTAMLFYQASAPTGWTQYTALNDFALRLTGGSGGSTGGSSAFGTVFQNQTISIGVSGGVSGGVGATTLGINEMPGHSHSMARVQGYNQGGTDTGAAANAFFAEGSFSTNNTGGNGAHSHSFSGSFSGSGSGGVTLNVRYANIIICTKN